MKIGKGRQELDGCGKGKVAGLINTYTKARNIGITERRKSRASKL
jgi:hypothetical protein